MKKNFVTVVSCILALVLLAACTTAPKTSAAQTIRIGTQPWIGYGPWWIAQDKGLFQKYGLNVELVNFEEDKEVNAAFASGNMEAANLATHTALKLFSAGVYLKLVLLEDESISADAILSAPGISSIADLKGKSVAYEEGSTSDLLLNYALSQNNMTLADITPVPMPASDAGTALLTGKVPAAVTYEPYISEITSQSKNFTVLYKAGERPGLISDVFVVNAKWAQENPETITKLLQVWDEALTYYNSNPTDAQAIIAKGVGSQPEDLVTAFNGVKFYTTADNKEAQNNGSFLSTIQDVAAVSKTIGLFDTVPDLSKLIDSSYMK